MDFLTKWQLKKTLSEEEAILVLEELFKGANKTFEINSTSKINKLLWRIYEKFPEDSQSKTILRFSSEKTELPFVSTNKFDNIKNQHEIYLLSETIYIY